MLDKANLISLLHHDIKLNNHFGEGGACTLLAGIEATVMSLSNITQSKHMENKLVMPISFLINSRDPFDDKLKTNKLINDITNFNN